VCRLLGFFSSDKTNAFAPLTETDKSIWRQSIADPRQRQEDGWGIAWYEVPGLPPGVVRSARPLPRQKPLLEQTAARARGQISLFHLRRASNPRGLPRHRLRGLINVQPFRDGAWTFVHNGSIPFPDETAKTLGALRRRIRGRNDSETLFWALRRELHRARSVPRALRGLRRRLKHVFETNRRKKAGTAWHHRGLNILLSNGRALWAYAEAPPVKNRGARPSALCTKDWPYFQLAFLPGRDRVWVASEPLWAGANWRPIRSGELLEIGSREGRVVWRKYRL
jgi:predicted glutamine amidotransferase